MLKIYKLPSVTPRQVLLFFLIGVLLITLVAGAFAYRKSQIAGASSTCDRVFRALPQDITNGINRNKADYVAVSNATGVPWEQIGRAHV